ncbi:MAG: TolC family protein [Candidatus Eisenbacteria bacterium]
MRATGRLADRLRDIAPYPTNPVVSLEVEGAGSPFSSRDYTRRLSIEQELDLRGERSARRQVGRATAGFVQRDLTAREQEIAASVDAAVGRWLVARRSLALLQPLAGRARTLESSAESARKRETVTAFAARLLRNEAVVLDAEVVMAQEEESRSSAEVRVWLGMSASDSLQFVDDLGDASWSCPPEAALVLAQRTRGDLARAAAAESLFSTRVRLERRLGGVNPTIGISAASERLYFDSVPLAGGGTAGPIQDRTTLIGIHASIPLPLTQRNQGAVAEAEVDLERARAERTGLAASVAQEVTGGCAALERAEARRSLLSGAAEDAGKDLRLIEDAYRGGRIPLEDYLTLRDRLVRVQRDYLEATAAVEDARARLVRATGTRRDLLTRFLRTEER